MLTPSALMPLGGLLLPLWKSDTVHFPPDVFYLAMLLLAEFFLTQ